jgi:hypothetical protein
MEPWLRTGHIGVRDLSRHLTDTLMRLAEAVLTLTLSGIRGILLPPIAGEAQ